MNGVVLAVACLAVVPAAAAQIELPASLKDLEKAARHDSNDAAAHYNVGLAYWNAKRYDDAERSFRTAIALDARFPAAYIGLSFLPYARRSRLAQEVVEGAVPKEWEPTVEEAEKMYVRGTLLDPFVELRLGYLLRRGFDDILAELQREYGDGVRDYFAGMDQLYRGDNEKGFELLQRVLNFIDADRHPNRAWANLLWAHGVVAGRLSKWTEAKSDFGQLLQRSLDIENKRRDSLVFVPLGSNELRYIMAILHQRAGEPTDAIRLYREAIQNDIGLFMAHVHLAEIYEGLGQWDQAIEARRNAVNANPDDPSLQMDLGWLLAKRQRFVDAEAALAEAAERAPRDPRSRYYLALVQQQLGKTADARSTFQRFLAIAPSRYQRQIADAQQRLETLR